MRTKVKPIDLKRIAQIFALYIFALLAAVSCGPALKVIDQENPEFGASNANGSVTVSFKPQLVSISKSGAMDDVMVNYSIADEARAIYFSSHHLIAEVSQTKTVDGITYELRDVCTSRTCNEIVLLITKTEAGMARAQSAFLIVGSGSTMSIQAKMDGTSFNRPTEALSFLKK